MFTGIVEELGSIKQISSSQIEISCKKILEDMSIGDSIAVNGICLTVTTFDKDSFSADVMPETIRSTSLDNLKSGAGVNLERALKPSDRIGGHLVSGHIDGTGVIKSMKAEGNAIIVKVSADKELLKYMIRKGSVTLDGMSLTLVKVMRDGFSVSLIPHTRDVTNFKDKRIGSLVNIETDVIAKYVEHFLNLDVEYKPTAITRSFLMENGY